MRFSYCTLLHVYFRLGGISEKVLYRCILMRFSYYMYTLLHVQFRLGGISDKVLYHCILKRFSYCTLLHVHFRLGGISEKVLYRCILKRFSYCTLLHVHFRLGGISEKVLYCCILKIPFHKIQTHILTFSSSCDGQWPTPPPPLRCRYLHSALSAHIRKKRNHTH